MRIEEKFERAMRRLEEFSGDGVPIIVEGRRDAEKLRELGIEGPVIKILGRSVPEFCEEIGREHREAVVLTDFDRQGAKYASDLEYHLRRNGVKVNTKLRKEIFGNSFANAVEELKKGNH